MASDEQIKLPRDVRLAQYDRCRQDAVQYDAMLWQIPGVAYVINAAGLGFVATGDVDGLGGTLVALTVLVLTFPLTLALIKNRMFQKARVHYAGKLLGPSIVDIPTEGPEAVALVEAEERAAAARRGPEDRPRLTERLVVATEQRLRGKGAYNTLLLTLLFTHVVQILCAAASPVLQ